MTATAMNLPALPQTARELATGSIIESFLPPAEQRSLNLPLNYMQLVARDNPELEALDFIDFLQKIELTGADPRRGQAHLITFRKNLKYKDSRSNQWVDNWKTRGQVVYGYQFFLAKAHQTGQLDGWHYETKIAHYMNPFSGEKHETIVSTATVRRKDMGQPIIYRAWLPEFAKMKEGQPTEQWATKPVLMLEKCALANALRLAFPEALGGMYISEEIRGDEVREEMPPVETRPPVSVVRDVTPQVAPSEPEAAPVEAKAPEAPEAKRPPARPAQARMKARTEAPPSDEAPAEAAAPEAPKTSAPPKTAKVATADTRKKLWNLMQSIAQEDPDFDLESAGAKLAGVKLTEEMAQSLLDALGMGDTSYFA